MTDEQYDREAIEEFFNEGCPNFDREPIEPGERILPSDYADPI
jgi:hypothetical protein